MPPSQRPQPNFNARGEVLPCCVTPDRPPAYPPTTAGQHLLDKYASTHAGYTHNGAAADAGGTSTSGLAAAGGSEDRLSHSAKEGTVAAAAASR